MSWRERGDPIRDRHTRVGDRGDLRRLGLRPGDLVSVNRFGRYDSGTAASTGIGACIFLGWQPGDDETCDLLGSSGLTVATGKDQGRLLARGEDASG